MAFPIIEPSSANAMQKFHSTAETIPDGMGFSLFSPLHLAWLLLFLAAAVFCSLLYRRLSPADRKRARYLFAVLLIADELFKVVCLLIGGNFLYGYLPFHLCSINIFLIAIHAVRPCRLLGSFLYTVCIPAAAAALLFPTWTSLPLCNFMHQHSSTIHNLQAVNPIMLTARCLAFLALLAIPVYAINLLLGTNFMFLMYAPKGNPLYWFGQTFGNHLIGYPFLIAAVVALMFLPPALMRRLRRAKVSG